MRQFFRLNALLVVAAILLSACSKGSVKRQVIPEQPRGETGPVTLRVGVMEGTAAVERLDPIIAAFQQQNTNYRVEKVLMPKLDVTLGYDQQMDYHRQLLKKGDLDLILDDGLTSLMGPEGLLVDLTPLIQKSRVDLKPFEAVLADLRQGNSLFVLPYAVNPQLVVYNPDLVKAAGVTLPQDTWTWDQFRQAAKSLSRGAGVDKVWGFDCLYPEELSYIWLQEATVSLKQSNEDAGREFLRFMSDLVKVDQSVPKHLHTNGSSNPTYFLDGKAGLSLVGLDKLNSAGRNWQVAPYPVLTGAKPAALVRMESYVIPEASSHQDAAWALLSFMVSQDGAMALARAGFLPFGGGSDVRQAWLQTATKYPPGIRVLSDVTWVATPPNLDGKTRLQALGLAGMAVLDGTKTWEQAAEEFRKAVSTGVHK
jgi:ABC-type glycerol-3-phosphate transport system substrate-binding protein